MAEKRNRKRETLAKAKKLRRDSDVDTEGMITLGALGDTVIVTPKLEAL